MEFLKQNRVTIEKEITDVIKSDSTLAPILKEMLPHAFTGGKMIRGTLLLETLKGFKCPISRDHLLIAGAIELVHTYSLIHDDLPAMDNDDLRRGKPTLHKLHGDALAILAGDAALTYAFTLISETDLPPKVQIKLVQKLAAAAGGSGMIYGQILDISPTDITLEQLQQIHNLKTGRMITLPLVMGAIIADLPEKTVADLTRFGDLIGQAFQAKDDLLDATATATDLGKTPGKDAEQHKLTYITLLGPDETKKLINRLTEEALLIIKPYQLTNLETLTHYLNRREQ